MENQMQPVSNVETLRAFIVDELIKALGWSPSGWFRKAIEPIFHHPTERFARLAASFDQHVAQFGFRQAAEWVLPNFARKVKAFGAERVPLEGPLLIAANHPGTCDALVVAANLPRQDLKIVASGMAFLRGLPSTARHLIYTSRDTHERMNVVRAAIRHLQQGGALLIFPSGGIDPDPAVLPDAEEELRSWSKSVEIFLNKVPDVQVVIAIISGVLATNWMRSPLTWLRKTRRDRQRVAEFMQTIHQMFFPRKLLVSPAVSFGEPLSPAEISQVNPSAGLLENMVLRARLLLRSHIQRAATS